MSLNNMDLNDVYLADTSFPFAINLRNNGISCFSNSLIQALVTLSDFRYIIKDLCTSNIGRIYQAEENKNNVAASIVEILCEIFRALDQLPSIDEINKYSDKYKLKLNNLNYLTHNFYKLISRGIFNENEDGKGNRQQDSNELLVQLFDLINIKNKSFSHVYMVDTNIINKCDCCEELFGVIQNQKVNYLTYYHDSFENEESFKYNIENIPLNWNDNDFKNTLHPNIISFNTTYISSVSSVLIIFIQRTGGELVGAELVNGKLKGGVYINKKYNGKISKPEIDLIFDTNSYQEEKTRHKYNLVSALVHKGEESNNGHYYCIAKRYKNEWYMLNDMDDQIRPSKIDIDNTLKSDDFLKNVTFLFYQKTCDKH